MFLRTAQHFDGLEVEERLGDELLVRDEHAVDVVRDARIGRRRRLTDTHAADVDERRAIVGVDRDGRRDLLNIGDVVDALSTRAPRRSARSRTPVCPAS